LESKTLRVIDPYRKGKEEYCGPRDLPTITLEKLKLIKYSCFLLLQEMFFYKRVSMIDAYLHRISETTLKSYRPGFKIFVYFLVEENYNNSDWEDKNVCEEILKLGAISKFLTVFIPDFNFTQSNFVKNIKRSLIKDKPKNPRYSNI
jgi:hypothetical protein